MWVAWRERGERKGRVWRGMEGMKVGCGEGGWEGEGDKELSDKIAYCEGWLIVWNCSQSALTTNLSLHLLHTNSL